MNLNSQVKSSICLVLLAVGVVVSSSQAEARYIGRLVRGEWQESWDKELVKDINKSGLLSHDDSAINKVCPGYSGSREVREVFWHQLMVSVSWRESLHNTTNFVDFHHGVNVGLFQLDSRLDEAYGCHGNLYNANNNIDCAVKMTVYLVDKYDSFLQGSKGGMAAYWQTLRNSTGENHDNRIATLKEVRNACQSGTIDYISIEK